MMQPLHVPLPDSALDAVWQRAIAAGSAILTRSRFGLVMLSKRGSGPGEHRLCSALHVVCPTPRSSTTPLS